MDDKKKITILGALFVVMISVGAFQFTRSSAPEPVAEKKVEQSTSEAGEAAKKSEGEHKEATSEEGAKGEENATGAAEEVDPALVAAARLNPRDPFDGTAWDVNYKATQQAIQSAAASAPKPMTKPAPRPRPMGGSGFKPLPIGDAGALPMPEGGGAPVAGNKLPSIDDFPYTVAGTMLGDRPCVVFTDASGKQKLVGAGGAIDGDSRVVSISKGLVTVNHRGKTKTFRVGGMNPSNDKNEDKR